MNQGLIEMPNPYKTVQFLVLSACLLLAPGLVLADPHRISFSVTEQQTVENDRLHVVFAAQYRASTADQVSQRVNQIMQAALNELSTDHRQYAQTGNYHVRPHFQRDGRISEWSGQQDLRLNLPKDNADITGVLSSLQRHLIYQSVRADISPNKRQQVEQALLSKAIQKYQQQAKFIAQAFNEKHYRLAETRLQPNYALPLQARSLTASDTNAPSIEMGSQTLSVTIDGVLEIN
ncbi:MAG: SIMPL domain-containing protein [Thiomicrospira sp.]|nr:SIMPL domain-containing protein [Thiomicrospira sp.]